MVRIIINPDLNQLQGVFQNFIIYKSGALKTCNQLIFNNFFAYRIDSCSGKKLSWLLVSTLG